jgi:DNA anti-recombination protein RmuC
MTERLRSHIREAKRIASASLAKLNTKKLKMRIDHTRERERLTHQQRDRGARLSEKRISRMRGGLKGAFDFLTGQYWKMRKRNEIELHWASKRDVAERDSLINA